MLFQRFLIYYRILFLLSRVDLLLVELCMIILYMSRSWCMILIAALRVVMWFLSYIWLRLKTRCLGLLIFKCSIVISVFDQASNLWALDFCPHYQVYSRLILVASLGQSIPFSLYLFIIVIVFLSRGLDHLFSSLPFRRYTEAASIHVSHLSFVNDSVIFASRTSLQHISTFFHHYELLQVICFIKPRVVFREGVVLRHPTRLLLIQ